VAGRQSRLGVRAAGSAEDRGRTSGIFLACLATGGSILVSAGVVFISGRGAGEVAVPGNTVVGQSPVAAPFVVLAIGADQVGGSALRVLGDGGTGGSDGGGGEFGAEAIDSRGSRGGSDPLKRLGFLGNSGHGGNFCGQISRVRSGGRSFGVLVDRLPLRGT